ncbi:imidazole glycerol phosphate synthase subunit HisH [Salirhabdus salicampi]|uniref:imidazole glycerol phosphate synthase subunit HisH n=1 Tax=Salirhabdus salicampi TaxID=476102 RepID=UPI0020C52FE1|nr:imidazole glycerol phosphate synthase subunit HisH [Salirhabdus salicampi]MCP8616114.1 imidazole glycerol phosphate synthase subunit HisH [Salirhabdus salicampi]
MIGIIDYGAGNLKSVSHALDQLGLDRKIISTEREVNESDALILPGVGAFRDAMVNLENVGLVDVIKENVTAGKPILGICLGMQLFYETSYENGKWAGLGLLKGEVVRFEHDLKIPHMGWNQLLRGNNDEIGNGIGEGEYTYFVHSYYVNPKDENEVVFWTDYGIEVPAVVRKDNVVGMQFHPEKSSKTGMKLLSNFGEMVT